MAVFFTVLMEFLIAAFGQYAVTIALKISLFAIFLAMFVAGMAAYIASAGALINGIAQTVPQIVHGVWGWVMPDNTNILFVIIGSVYLLRFVTNLYLSVLNAKFKTAASR